MYYLVVLVSHTEIQISSDGVQYCRTHKTTSLCMALNVLSKFLLKCFLIFLHVVVYSAIIGRSRKDFKKYLLNFMRVMPLVSLSLFFFIYLFIF